MDLFENDFFDNTPLPLVDGAVLLRRCALQNESILLKDLNLILAKSPLRHMVTPGGHSMSVAMTNCGSLGWVTDRKGYRYSTLDPTNNKPWQAMPASFLALAVQAADAAGYVRFIPDACLINQYKTGARMALHQDKDEQDFSQPIVSVSLGVSATFLFGGLKRSDKPIKIQLNHGDVIVWGGESRLNYHGIMPLKANNHAVPNNEMLSEFRFNLTFRKAD